MVLQLPLVEAMCRIEEEHQELLQLDVHQLASIQETTHFTSMLLTVKKPQLGDFFRQTHCRISGAVLVERYTCNFYMIANLQLS